LAQITRGDITCQDILRAKIFYILVVLFSSIPKKWILVARDKRLLVSLCLLFFFLTWPEILPRLSPDRLLFNYCLTFSYREYDKNK